MTKASTRDLLLQAKRLAHERAGVPCQEQAKLSAPPVLPVTVPIKRNDATTQEHLLYKLGEPSWEPRSAAQRLAWTLGLQEKDERPIEEEFTRATKPFAKHVATALANGKNRLTAENRILLKICCHHDGMVLHDEASFDLGELGGCGTKTAYAVQQYAATVTRDLQLSHDWFVALSLYVATLVAAAAEDLREAGPAGISSDPQALQGSGIAHLEPITPLGAVRAAPSQLPCLLPIDPALQAAEQERERRRDEKIAARRKRQEEMAAAAAAAQAQQQQQQQPLLQQPTTSQPALQQ